MSEHKLNKAAHGRHAAGANKKNNLKDGAEAGQHAEAAGVAASEPVLDPDIFDTPLTTNGETAVMPSVAPDEGFGQTVPSSMHPGAYDAQAYEGYATGNPMMPLEFGPEKDPARKRKVLKIVGIVLGVLVALLVVAYLGVAIFFTSHFMPNSTVGDKDISLMSSADAENVLVNQIDDYELAISGQGFSLELTASKAGLSVDESSVVTSMLGDVNPWLWPVELSRTHDLSGLLVAKYNDSGLTKQITDAVNTFNATATQPTNATITYDAEKNAFVVTPEAVGTALDPNAVVAAADEALLTLSPTAKLTTAELLQPTVLATDTKLTSAAASANNMIKADLVLNMGGFPEGEVNADVISQWVRLGDDLKATLDEGALTAWVEQLEAACDTVGTSRTYTRPDGKVITVAGGVYGWEVDHDALLTMVRDGVMNGTVATLEVPTLSTGTAYNGAGAQDWGARYCDIDLAEQYVRFYDETGACIWESACISGTPDGTHDTSVGVFWMNQKSSPQKLIGYDLTTGEKLYESSVQYWMPFDGNAIGMHDADWQPDFGGTMYANGYGSHGCVNLPPYKAAELYGIIQEGDVVVSHW